MKRTIAKILLLLAVGLAAAGAARAQSTPNFTTGQVPTAGQWNGYFGLKADALNGVLTGATLDGTVSIDGYQITFPPLAATLPYAVGLPWTINDCVKVSTTSGGLADAGAACGSGGGGGGGLTIGTTTITGGTSTYCLTQVSGLLQSQACGTGAVMTGSSNGIGRPDSVTTVVNTGVFSVTDTIQAARTSAITFIASDMGTKIPANSGVSSITISNTNFASTVFGPGQTSCVENNTAGAITVTNSSGASMYPAVTALQIGETICLTGDGTNMYASVTKAPISNVASGGTGLSSVTSGAILKGAGANPLTASALSDTGALVSSSEATASTPFALTDGATITPDGAHDNYTLAITGNHTMLNPTTLNPGQNITFQITQPATGGTYTYQITWGGDYTGMSGSMPTLNTGASAVTFISCKVYSSSSLYCAGGAPVANNLIFTCPITFTTGTGSGTLSCFFKAPRAFTVDNIVATASGTFSSITPTFYECGTSTTCASSPTSIGSGAVTSANTATPITVASSTINSGDYVAVEITAASSTSGQLVVQAAIH